MISPGPAEPDVVGVDDRVEDHKSAGSLYQQIGQEETVNMNESNITALMANEEREELLTSV